MLALMPDWLGVGVKVAVRTRPVPLKALNVPPVTTISPDMPSQIKLLPTSSLKVNVMTRVSLLVTDAALLVITTNGAAVSVGGGGMMGALPFPLANTGIPMAAAAISPSPILAAATDAAGAAVGMMPIKEPGLNKATLQSRAESLVVQTRLSGTSKISAG